MTKETTRPRTGVHSHSCIGTPQLHQGTDALLFIRRHRQRLSLFCLAFCVLLMAMGCRAGSSGSVNPEPTSRKEITVESSPIPSPTVSAKQEPADQGKTARQASPLPSLTASAKQEPANQGRSVGTLSPVPISPFSVKLDPGEQWKTFDQLEADLATIIGAGYSKVCLFDLRSVWGYPDSRYIPLLKKYSDSGIEITIYAQELESDQTTLNVFQSIGASSVIVYEKNLSILFRRAGVKTFWWSVVAYPLEHRDQLQYKDWLDLRSDQVRENIANWAVQVPQEVDGGLSLDYIRWNKVGDGRTAEQVTDLVQRIRTNWNAVGRGILSAAVYPYLGAAPSYGGALSVGQKWDEWLRNGLLDFAYPMAYDSQDIPWLIGEWKAYDKRRIVPCLSVIDYSNANP